MPLRVLVLSVVLDCGHSNRHSVVLPHCHFNLWFPMASDVKPFFICLHCHFNIFFVQVSVQTFAHFLNWIIYFLIVEFLYLFVYFGYKSFDRYMFCKYFLPVCGLSFHYVESVICREKRLVFYFNEVKLLISWLMQLVLYFKTHCQLKVK